MDAGTMAFVGVAMIVVGILGIAHWVVTMFIPPDDGDPYDI